jgi:thiol-disulfide isomerase/thioredoxin
MNRKTLLYAFAGLFALVIGGLTARTLHEPRPAGTQVPPRLWATSLPDSHGQEQALSQWRGEVLVLNFWATWCPPCREEIPDFMALRKQYQPRKVEFVGIAIDNAGSVAAFLREAKITYPILIGEGEAHALAQALGNASGALPFTIVVDRAGSIVLSHLGRLPRARLEGALQQNAAP